METKKNNTSVVVLLILAIIMGIIINIFSYKNTSFRFDELGHYNTMRGYYDRQLLPVMGAYTASQLFIGDDSFARVPGGYFYTEYLIKNILGFSSFNNARFVNLISMFIVAGIFLFWVFKKFGFQVFSIITTLILLNGYFINTSSAFYNPNSVFLLSFIFLPVFASYIENKKSFAASLMLFPILALMGQSHLATYFSLTITLVVYLIIRWNKQTKYNILGFSISIFISFLTYLPYLVYEMNNGFINTQKIFLRQNAIKVIEPPQIYSVLLYPTREMGGKYTNGIKDIISPLFSRNFILIANLLLYIISILFVLIALIVCIRLFIKHIKTKQKLDKKIMLLDELIFFYLLYIFVTIISFMFISRTGSGRGHYFYSAFTLSFIPVIHFIVYIKKYKPNILKYIIIFSFLTVIIVPLYIINNTKNSKLHGWTPLVNHIEKIYNDANGEYFHIEVDDELKNKDFSYIGDINKDKNNIKLKYLIIEKYNSNITNNYNKLEFLYSDNFYEVFKIIQ